MAAEVEVLPVVASVIHKCVPLSTNVSVDKPFGTIWSEIHINTMVNKLKQLYDITRQEHADMCGNVYHDLKPLVVCRNFIEQKAIKYEIESFLGFIGHPPGTNRPDINIACDLITKVQKRPNNHEYPSLQLSVRDLKNSSWEKMD